MMTNARRRNRAQALERLRLPELWKRFAELTGETTRSPNKTYLIRRICDALEKKESRRGAAPARPAPPKKTGKTRKKKPKRKARSAGKGAPKARADITKPLHQLTVEELQDRYREVVGRTTGSKNPNYMVWKIRQAEKGRIPIGPIRRGTKSPGDFKVIPLRIETEIADQIDAARERLQLPSRTALIRRALMLYLAKAGENDVAALLEPGE